MKIEFPFKKLVLITFITLIFNSSFAQNPKDYLSKGSKVYIESNNKNVIKHTNDKIILWGYWKPVELKNQADFILNLDASFSLYYTINAQAITKDNRIIKRFDAKNSFRSWDGNPKRGAVKALFDKEIIPFVHGIY